MKYRDAKNLKPTDNVIRKSDGACFQVVDIEVYGSVQKVRINCVDWDDCFIKASFFQDEVE